MTRSISRLGLSLVAIVSAASLSAQTPNTGLLVGKVLNEQGGAVSGATVTLSGPAMQGGRSVTTDAEGRYRFAFVPTGGWYQLSVTKTGIVAPAVKNIVVEAWKTINNDIKTKTVASLTTGTTVEVVAAGSNVTVDNTTVTTSSTFSAESLKAMPLASRDVAAAAYLAPGVVDGGRGEGNPNIGGGTGFENNFVLDGVNVTDPLYGENKTRVNSLAVESVQIQTGGFEPEYGRATGGVISVVTKTGSNEWHADLEATARPKSMVAMASAQVELPWASARFEGGNEMTTSFWVGGPILKDKLWLSLGAALDKSNQTQSTNPMYVYDREQADNNPFQRLVSAPGLHNNGITNDLATNNLGITAKLTYALNADNTLEFALGANRNKGEYSILGQTFNEYGGTATAKDDIDNFSFNWRSSLTSSWLLDARAGFYKRHNYAEGNPQRYLPFVNVPIPPYYLSGAWLSDGSAPYWSFNNARGYAGMQLGGDGVDADNTLTRKQLTIKGTNFIGSHTLKYGLDYDETEYDSKFRYTGDFLIQRDVNLDPDTGAFVSFRDRYRFRKGSASQGVTINGVPGVLLNGAGLNLDSKTKNMALFVQDSWQINSNFLVVYGVRADSQRLFGGDGVEYLKFGLGEMLAPRLGVTWDPWGDGKTKFQVSYGTFYETIPMDLNQRAGSAEGFVRYQRTITDENLLFGLPTVNDFLDVNAGTMRAGVSQISNIGGAKADIDPDIKPQSISELGFRFERNLTTNWKTAIGFKYRKYNKVIEDFSDDFGHTYWLGNPGQNGKGLTPIHVVDYDRPGQDEWITFPKPVRNYRETTFSLAKGKGGDRWSMDAHLVFALNEGNFAGLDSPLNGQADPNITSTYDLPVLMRNTYGTLPNSPRYNLQVNGTYEIGMGFSAGLRFQYRQGTAISAMGPDLGYIYGPRNESYGATDYYVDPFGNFLHESNYGNNEALVEPRGSRGWTPDVSRLDLHFEYEHKFPALRNSRLTVFMDIFNVLNQQMALTVNQAKQVEAWVSGQPADANGNVLSTDPNDANLGVIAVDNPRFLKPLSFQAPRSIQVGVRFSF